MPAPLYGLTAGHTSDPAVGDLFYGPERKKLDSHARSVTKRTLLHNIFDSECLKSYYIRSKLGQFVTAKKRLGGGWRLDVLQRICLSLKCCSLSVTVSNNTDKNHRSTAYIIRTDAQELGSDGSLAWFWSQSACATQREERHLLVHHGCNGYSALGECLDV